MTEQVATRPPAEPTKAQPRKAAEPAKPTTTLTVPAKPAAITGANVATLVGTAAAAAGPIGWVVAGAAAMGGAVYAARRRHTVRRSADGTPRSSRILGGTPGGGRRFPLPSWPWSAGSGSRASRTGPGSGHGGPGGAGRKRAGGSRAGLPGLSAPRWPGASSKRDRSGGGTRGGSGATGGRPGRLARLWPGGNGRGGGTGRSGGTGGRTPSRGRLVPPGLSRRLAALDGRISKAASKPGQAALDAVARRRAARRKLREAARAKGLPDPGLWPRSRRWVRRNVLGIKDQPATKPTAQRERKQPPQRRTGDRVERPNSDPAGQRRQRTSPRPDRASNTKGTPIMGAPSTDTPQPTSPLFHAARQLLSIAASYKPKGMLHRRSEAYEMPHTLGEIAKALRLLAQTHIAQEPLNPAYAAAVQQIAACVDSAAEASRRLGPAFDGLHPTEVARLLKPRAGEAMWDTSNNKP